MLLTTTLRALLGAGVLGPDHDNAPRDVLLAEARDVDDDAMLGVCLRAAVFAAMGRHVIGLLQETMDAAERAGTPEARQWCASLLALRLGPGPRLGGRGPPRPSPQRGSPTRFTTGVALAGWAPGAWALGHGDLDAGVRELLAWRTVDAPATGAG